MKSKIFEKLSFFPAVAILLPYVILLSCQTPAERPLFDGETFNGWEGDTTVTWRITDGAIVGGSLENKVPNNNFLVTTKQYEDFILKLKFKLEGTDGFINAGIQFHSQRLENPDYEMIGYQADMGKDYWGALYDESRRKKVLQKPDSLLMKSLVNFGDWNDYEIRSKDGNIQLFLNGQKTVDYTEKDRDIPQKGHIGLQIHGEGKAQVWYRDILIEELD